ncbi:hypothetical protein E1B28_002721 [Marasmius oreades]|uniref:Glycosyltransferase 61 catalytic domain-containing protein n=1 Tax=Marasmius oreades TaxID=181124 RepID=A0A9P7ULU2_9AGAR|nr:uncharacterized protein E1B28_002721 [Marasmius oreades]KAG7086793.1 hypothetical protein E1B28_002721 [Marasmius oreades]
MIPCCHRRRCLLLLLLVAFFALVSHFWLGSYTNIGLTGVFQGEPASLQDDVDHQGRLKQTTIPSDAHTHGFTVFEELYLRDGTLYIMTDNPDSFPPLSHILSQPGRRAAGVSLTPTDNEMQVINPADAEAILGDRVLRLSGFTVLLYEPEQFMNHYYHWWGEIVLGLWRVYSKLGTGLNGTITPLPFPARFIAPFVEESGWRDPASINGPIMRVAFPTTAVENGHYWQDLIEIEATVVFSRVIVVNRESAHLHPFSGLWYKMIAGTMNVTVPEGFWEPIRHSVLNNLLGYIPKFDAVSSKPVVTYITRQRRTLIHSHHRALVRELRKLRVEGICEVLVVRMEEMTLKQQIELAARTTIMLGVHGNGLTHQLWMTPSTKSTVIEIFIPTGYTFDYELLARNLGHRHYGIWNDTALTYPKGTTHKGVNFPPGFHGNDIPVQAETVTRIIRERLQQPSLSN